MERKRINLKMLEREREGIWFDLGNYSVCSSFRIVWLESNNCLWFTMTFSNLKIKRVYLDFNRCQAVTCSHISDGMCMDTNIFSCLSKSSMTRQKDNTEIEIHLGKV